MLFSILIANYNNGKFFSDCYKSILNQTYQNWEVIIVDDCSEDNSLEIIENLTRGDHRFKVFKNDKNRGCGFTKNRCGNLAKGEICGFLDPDDTIKPLALEIMAEKFQNDEKLALVSSRYEFVDEKLNYLSDGVIGGEIPIGKSYLTSFKGEITHFAVFKRKYFLQKNGIDLRMKRAVDQDLYLKLEECGKHCFVNKVLYSYRQNTNGISQNENWNKSVYWAIYARKKAHKRRKKSNVKCENIAKSELNSIESKFLFDSFMRKPRGHKFMGRLYLLIMSIIKFPSDRFFLKLKYLIILLIRFD